MSSAVISNRIEDLVAVLSKIGSTPEQQKIATEEAETLGQRMLSLLMDNAPVGRVEPNYTVGAGGLSGTISHGRPSIRLHGMTLGSGWQQPEIKPIDAGATFSIGSIAPHMKILLAGSPKHSYSGNPFLSFWHFKATGSDFSDRAKVRANINHPGFPRTDFVELSHTKLQTPARTSLSRMINNITKPLRDF